MTLKQQSKWQQVIGCFGAFILPFASLIGLSACEEKNMTSFDWLASESSPKYYPVEIGSGNLEVAHDGSTYIPSGVYLNKIKWGDFCSTHLSGPDGKLLPEKEAINGKLRYI